MIVKKTGEDKEKQQLPVVVVVVFWRPRRWRNGATHKNGGGSRSDEYSRRGSTESADMFFTCLQNVTLRYM